MDADDDIILEGGSEHMKFRKRIIFIWGCLFFVMNLSAICKADAINFPPRDVSELIGHSTCELPRESEVGLFRLPLNDDQGHAFEFRKKDNFVVVLLLTEIRNPGDCGKIVAALKLPKHKKGESIEFDCHFKKTQLKNKEVIIGLADNKNGRLRYVVARLAWRVDLEKHIFESLKKTTVVCDTAGYAK